MQVPEQFRPLNPELMDTLVPVLFFDESGIQGYLGWEELARLKAQFEASRAA